MRMQSIVIIDFGSGNLHSVAKAVEHVAPRAEVRVSADPAVIAAADRVLFPGQGAMGSCLAAMADRGLEPALRQALTEKPFLGICLGLQALFETSEEDGGTPGLGLFRGRVRRFPATGPTGEVLKIPHMGWNRVYHSRPHPLWAGIPDGERFYFVHSYYARADDPREEAGRCEYGVAFTAAAARGNVFAVQCHPEKSQRAGLKLLENFVHWDGRDDS